MEIFLELKADSVEKKLAQYKQELLNHISSEEDIRYPKLLLNYWPVGKRRPGRPLNKTTGRIQSWGRNRWFTGLTTGWTIGVREFDSRRELGIFLFSTASRPALGPTQPPFQWTPAALSPGVKQLEREAAHPPPFSAVIKIAWSYSSTHNASSWRGA